jgi:lauroyl/myristoyl acyltransferase
VPEHEKEEWEDWQTPGRLRLVWYFLLARLLVGIVGRLPRGLALRFAGLISLWVRRITAHTCRKNMDRVLGPLGWSEAEIDALFDRHQRYMVRLRAESAHVLTGRPSQIPERVEFVGLEHLEAAEAEGRGAIVTSAHEGTWWHIPSGLGTSGRGVRSVFASFEVTAAETWLARCSLRTGIKLSVVTKDARKSFSEAAESGDVMYIAIDLTERPHDRYWHPFGSSLINIDPGPFIMARRLRMPIVPARSRQRPDGISEITFSPPIRLYEPGAPSPAEMARDFAAWLHREVTKAPDQWWCWGFMKFRRRAAGEEPEESAPTVGVYK